MAGANLTVTRSQHRHWCRPRMRPGSDLASFFPFAISFAGGVRVAGIERAGVGRASVLAVAGPGGQPEIRALVLLYELLTGTAAYAKVVRLIKEEEEEEPPKPSTRLSDSGEALESILARWQTEPAKLTRLVRGELDWIVMKCLEKDRNRRYETASAFAADVERYLRDEPVQACPPSAVYRLRKFVRRHKGAVLAASLVVLALVGGIIGTTVGLVQAEQANKTGEKRLA